jgi:hypothetical protein
VSKLTGCITFAAQPITRNFMAGVSDSEFEELPECEPAWLRRHHATACRRRLFAAGYSPLPVNGKAPPVPGWQNIVVTNEIISAWEDKYPDATNTGILTGNTAAIDIDVLYPAVADELQLIAERMIGTSAVRTGHAPKRAMLFQTDAPFDKISTPIFISPDGRTHKVEILGRGQQIVVYGIHPDTHAPYTWQGGELGPQLKCDALPKISVEQANEFILAAAHCMSAHGWAPKQKPNGNAAGSCNSPRTALERERAYARAALDGCADEVAKAAIGERNDTLNKKAFRLGTMVARSWIPNEEVCDALLAAADACGLNRGRDTPKVCVPSRPVFSASATGHGGELSRHVPLSRVDVRAGRLHAPSWPNHRDVLIVKADRRERPIAVRFSSAGKLVA